MSTDATAVKPRRGTQAKFRNIYVAYNNATNSNPENCVISDDSETSVDLDYAIFENCGSIATSSVDGGTLKLGTNISTDGGLPTYIDPSNYGTLADLQSAGSSAFVPGTVDTRGETPPNDGFFDPTAVFYGAVGSVNWMANWVEFPAN